MDPMIGRVIAGRYEILQRIGSGGMGSVYKARQASVARQVALKVLRPDLVNNDHIRQRFHREAEIIGRLSHPNTIRLYEFCTTDDGLAVMVMELLEGQPLSERLKSDGPIGMLESIQIGIEAARSLSEAHLLGLVHRDLKPANIFLHEVGGQIITKVLDFGIARLMDEEATRLTVTDQVFGTPRYMSPEQGLSTASVDARSDIYSLGLIIYECIIGQPPFVAQTSYQYLSAHSAQPPPKLRGALPSAPESLDALIDACLEKKPEDRPQSADAVATHLEAIKRSLEAGAPAPPPFVRTPRPSSTPMALGPDAGSESTTVQAAGRPDQPARPPILAGVAALAVVVVLGVAAWFVSRSGPGNDGGADVNPAAVAVVPVERPDAGQAETEETPTPAPDAGFAPKKEKKRKRSGDRPPRRRRPKKKQVEPGVGSNAIAESGMRVIPGFSPDTDDVVERARDCTASTQSGNSALTTRSCPRNCAIMFDAQCAGRTPARARPVPSGKHPVVIVCRGQMKRAATLTFESDATTTFYCR